MKSLTLNELNQVKGGNPALAIGIGIGAVTGAINGSRNGGGISGALSGAAFGAAVAITGSLAVVTKGITALSWGVRSIGLGIAGGTGTGSITLPNTNDESNESDE